MRIIEIVALENGAHRNQTGSFSTQTIPNGWTDLGTIEEVQQGATS